MQVAPAGRRSGPVLDRSASTRIAITHLPRRRRTVFASLVASPYADAELPNGGSGNNPQVNDSSGSSVGILYGPPACFPLPRQRSCSRNKKDSTPLPQDSRRGLGRDKLLRQLPRRRTQPDRNVPSIVRVDHHVPDLHDLVLQGRVGVCLNSQHPLPARRRRRPSTHFVRGKSHSQHRPQARRLRPALSAASRIGGRCGRTSTKWSTPTNHAMETPSSNRRVRRTKN